MKVIIPYSRVRAYAKKIERRNLKKFGHSLSWVSMLNHVPKVSCIYFPENTVKVDSAWRAEFDRFVEE